MVEWARQNPVILALAVLAWFCWSHLDVDPARHKARPRLAEILPEHLPNRPAEEPAIEVSDPCRLEPRRPAADETIVEDVDVPAAEPDDATSTVFTLSLDSILHLAGGPLARISGQTVAPGQPLGGLDPDSPPVLQRIDGFAVEVAYRDQVIRLDLDRRSRLVIGGATGATDATGTEDGSPQRSTNR